MRVVEPAELTAPPTGDDNNTTAFVCRPAVGQMQPPRQGSSAAFARLAVSDGELASSLTRWSAHALGLAVDVNPFQNPYSKGDLVLPELATAYLDRDRDLPGMISGGGPVVAAFERIGWKWGGRWTSPVDRHHFSQTGT
jgi:hypothetical protein